MGIEKMKTNLNPEIIIKKYCTLKELSPRNKLLKYFILRKENFLQYNKSLEGKLLKKFGKGLPLFNCMEGISEKEYHIRHRLAVIKRYEEALDSEILRLSYGIKELN